MKVITTDELNEKYYIKSKNGNIFTYNEAKNGLLFIGFIAGVAIGALLAGFYLSLM